MVADRVNLVPIAPRLLRDCSALLCACVATLRRAVFHCQSLAQGRSRASTVSLWGRVGVRGAVPPAAPAAVSSGFRTLYLFWPLLGRVLGRPSVCPHLAREAAGGSEAPSRRPSQSPRSPRRRTSQSPRSPRRRP